MPIVNAEVIFNENAVIMDLANSPQAKYQTLFKLDKYKSVMEIGDSTRFFMKLEKSFYGAILTRDLVWSNPPYNIYNFE